MFKALMRVKLASIFNWLAGGTKQGKKAGKGKMILYGLLMVYVLGIFCWMFCMVFSALAEPMYTAHLSWLYFLMALIMAFALMVVFSVFMAKNQLYEAKDNELLLSMPIPPGAILASRMLLLLGMNLLFGLLVAAPAAIMWYGCAPFSAKALVCFIIVFLALCLFALAVSALFGWLLSLLASKMRRKTLFETILSLAFLGAYFYFYSKLGDIIENVLLSSMGLAETLGGVAVLRWIGSAAAGESVGYLLLSAMLLTIPFIVVYMILSCTFIKTATAKRGSAKIKYEDRGQRVSSRSSALLKREAARFFSSSTCIVNNGLGAVFILAGAVLLVVYRSELRQLMALLSEYEEAAMCIVAVFGAAMAGLVLPTSSSISLEGKNLWIIRSMPVNSSEVLETKLRFSLIIYVPPIVLLMAAAVYVLRPGALTALAAVVLSLLLLLVMAQMGLIANIRHPNLNWTTESQAAKSGVAVMISMLLDYGLIAALGFSGYMLLKNGASAAMVMGLASALMLVLSLLLRRRLRGGDAARFENIQA